MTKLISVGHVALTLATCACVLLAGAPWPFFFFWVPAFYAGREVAQAEHRYIQAHGGKRAACPWWCGLLPEAWTLKGLLDWLLPVLVASAACLARRLCP